MLLIFAINNNIIGYKVIARRSRSDIVCIKTTVPAIRQCPLNFLTRNVSDAIGRGGQRITTYRLAVLPRWWRMPAPRWRRRWRVIVFRLVYTVLRRITILTWISICSEMFENDNVHVLFLKNTGKKYITILRYQEEMHFTSSHKNLFSPNNLIKSTFQSHNFFSLILTHSTSDEKFLLWPSRHLNYAWRH